MTVIALALVYYSFAMGVSSAQSQQIRMLPLSSTSDSPALPLIPRVPYSGEASTPLMFRQDSHQESWPLCILNNGSPQPVIMVPSDETATNGMGSTILSGNNVRLPQEPQQSSGAPNVQELLPLQFHLVPRLPLELLDPAQQSGDTRPGRGDEQNVSNMRTWGRPNSDRNVGSVGSNPGGQNGQNEQKYVPGPRWRTGTRQSDNSRGSNAHYSNGGSRREGGGRYGNGGRGADNDARSNGRYRGSVIDRGDRSAGGGGTADGDRGDREGNNELAGSGVTYGASKGNGGYDTGVGTSAERARSWPPRTATRQPRDSTSYTRDSFWNSQMNNAQGYRSQDLINAQNSNYLHPDLMGPFKYSNNPWSDAISYQEAMTPKKGEWDNRKSSAMKYDQRRFDKRAVTDRSPGNANIDDLYYDTNDQTASSDNGNGMTQTTGERNHPSDSVSTGDTDNDDAWRRYVIQRMEAQEKYSHPSMARTSGDSAQPMYDGSRETDPSMNMPRVNNFGRPREDNFTNDLRTAIHLLQKQKFRSFIGEPLVFEILYVLYKALDGSFDDEIPYSTEIDILTQGNMGIPSSGRNNNQRSQDSESMATTNFAPGNKTNGTPRGSSSSIRRRQDGRNTSKHGSGRRNGIAMNDDDDPRAMRNGKDSPTWNKSGHNHEKRDSQTSTDQSESGESSSLETTSTRRLSRDLESNIKGSSQRGFKWILPKDGGKHNHRGPYVTTFRASGNGNSHLESNIPIIYSDDKDIQFTEGQHMTTMIQPMINNLYHNSAFSFEEEGDRDWTARKKRDGKGTVGIASPEQQSNYEGRLKDFFDWPMYASEYDSDQFSQGHQDENFHDYTS